MPAVEAQSPVAMNRLHWPREPTRQRFQPSSTFHRAPEVMGVSALMVGVGGAEERGMAVAISAALMICSNTVASVVGRTPTCDILRICFKNLGDFGRGNRDGFERVGEGAAELWLNLRLSCEERGVLLQLYTLIYTLTKPTCNMNLQHPDMT